MGNRFDHQTRGRQGTVALAGALGFALVSGLAARASAQTYLCPPAPEGVFGLTGGPRFAETPAPDQFATQLDDPRWNGAWREDFSDSSSTEASARILMDDTYLYISLQAIVDPDGAQVVSDAVYLGFSQDQTTGIAVKVLMDAASPTAGFTDDQTSVSTANWWKTTNAGATSWPKQGPQTWAAPPNVRLWTAPGTANGSAWAFNARLSLTDLGAALGAPGGKLTGQFYMWYQIDIETPVTTAHYGWPAGTTIGFDSASPCTAASMCAILPLSTFGIVNPTDTTKCPTGISIDPMSIGTTPVSSAGIPDTTVHYGTGHPGNQFVAVLTNTDTLNPPTSGSVKGRFRLSDWGSQIGGTDATWKDAATVGATTATAYGANDQAAGPLQVLMSCVNPPASGTNSCLQPTNANASTDQCLLVELSQGNGSGMRFVHDSARRNMDFVNASTFERSATVSVKGLAPLTGSTGTRDAYIYVRTLNMPATTDGNHQAPIPPPVPPVTKGRDGKPIQSAEAVNNQGPPRYRMTTYERVASVMPTYEVHVYHDTGKTVTEGGHTRHVVEPQAPFGYFVQHAGDLSGWRHALVGEGFVLEEISPNFYHARIPDNGSVGLHTTISSCQKHFFGLINKCGDSMVGCGGCQCAIGDTGVPAAAPVCLLVAAIVMRRRRRAR
ncbi:MAG TPA: MYXO-CTERM sorting domain-containing protein [Polyangia bacterium]|nr:MYXO-CTERM sorting domain-containing protein [Polyangia bacterium]